MDNDFFINTQTIKDEIDKMDLQKLSDSINATFSSITEFNNNWQDSYKNNSENFKIKMNNYNQSFLSIHQELENLTKNIQEQINNYIALEKVSINWE